MFWRKKEKVDWPLLLFGLVIIFIFISALGSVVFALIAYKKGYIQTESSQEKPITQSVESFRPTVEISTPLSVRREYAESIGGLLMEVESGSLSREQIISKVEELFFSVRVPEELKDLHLQVFLEIQDKKTAQLDDSSFALEIARLLGTLLGE